jgi:hypothetical protein
MRGKKHLDQEYYGKIPTMEITGEIPHEANHE